MLGQMSDPQAFTLFGTSVFGLFGLVGDYITTEMCIGKGASEGNPFTNWLLKKLHVSLPVLTFILAVALLVVIGLMATVIGGWWASIPPALVGVTRAIQSIKNYRLYKALRAAPVRMGKV